MPAKSTMQNLKKRIDQRLKLYFQKEIQKAAELDQTFREATKMVAEFTLSGGKRVRAALMYYGYLAGGGRKTNAILNASLSMELVHSFLIIHDDIIDNDEVRRGNPTLHRRYQKLFQHLKLQESENLGRSLAMLCGDTAYTMANQILCQSDFDDKLKIKAIEYFQKTLDHTYAGEIMEIINQASKKNIDSKKAIKIYKYKTAKYTIEGPLTIGSILAGANQTIINALKEYSILLGVAFQINDDLLGIYGNPNQIGKDIGSDLREGKKTLLLIKTLEKASNPEKKLIKSILGNKKITARNIKRFGQIAQKTGALSYCESLANNLSVRAKEIILNSEISGLARDFFLESANYIIESKR
ncbi:MAG: polyprenyl synthetase family protein [Patescibacteria group bacterium]|nr:polyprenyl synthetase family protein [Patescibacteria group bacterium]